MVDPVRLDLGPLPREHLSLGALVVPPATSTGPAQDPSSTTTSSPVGEGTSAELKADPAAEMRELTAIYVSRGLDATLAGQVAAQLMAHDPLGAHARDELGISTAFSAQPVQAALASAASFAVGAALPLAVAALVPGAGLITAVSGMSLVFLAGLGLVAARAGGAPLVAGAWRVTFWGALAMGITAGVGALFGAVV